MNIDIARAWKNIQYRETLTSEELTQLPENPVGTVELTDTDLTIITGACDGGCPSIGLNISLGLGGGCGSNDPQIWDGGSNGGWDGGASFHGGITYLPIPAPCHSHCSDPCH